MAQLASLHVMESHRFPSMAAEATEGEAASVDENCTDCTNAATLGVRSTTTDSVSVQLTAESHDRNTGNLVQENTAALNQRQSVVISWSDVTLSTKKGKDILKDLKGKLKPGELTAIMGPSGAGKTTLLNVLAGFTRQRHSGKILVNGADRKMNSFRNISCYVTQDNHLFDYLTVKESVELAAAFKIPVTVNRSQKELLVQKLLESLGMYEVRNNKIIKLSGGERKRLCIAQEIVSNPNLIILDEPTSGLDSSSCLQCINLLKSLAKEGRTVVCTIHQPSARILELFDKLYLIAEGKCVYRGPANKLVKFLKDQGLHCPQYHNPADFAMEVVSGEHGDWIEKLKEAAEKLNDDEDEVSSDRMSTILSGEVGSNFEASSSTVNILPVSDEKIKRSAFLRCLNKNSRDYPTSSWNQLKVLLRRNLLNTLRNPMLTHMQFLMYTVSSLFVGAMFNGIGNDAAKVHDNAGFIFFCATFNFFVVQTSTILTFPFEKVVVTREHLNNWYSVTNYFLARTITDLPYQIVLPIICTSIVYWITHQPPETLRFCLVTISTILMYIIAQAVGVIVGALFDAQTATFMTAGLTVPVVLFSGYIVTFDTMPVYLRWMSYLSYCRYIFLGIAFSIYGMDRPEMDCSSDICPTPEQFMKYLGVKDSEAHIYFGVPIIFILVFKIAGYYAIRYKINRATIR